MPKQPNAATFDKRANLLDVWCKSRNMMIKVVYPIVDNPADIEDILQDVYVKAHLTIHRFRGDCLLSSWLCTIARNTAISFVRKYNMRFVAQEVEEDVGGGPEQYCEQEEFWHGIAQSFADIPPSYRETLALYVQGDHSFDAISAICDTPVGTVKSRMARSRKMLRKDIPEMERIPSDYWGFAMPLTTGSEINLAMSSA